MMTESKAKENNKMFRFVFVLFVDGRHIAQDIHFKRNSIESPLLNGLKTCGSSHKRQEIFEGNREQELVTFLIEGDSANH